MSQSKEDLKGRVVSAFLSCPPPQEDELVEDDWDAASIRSAFSPYLQSALPAPVVEANAKSLPALKPKAFRYFLRDYLLYALEHFDSAVSEYLIFRLHDLDPDEEYGRERLVLFSKEQKDAIADCCEWFLQNSPVEERYLRKVLAESVLRWRQ